MPIRWSECGIRFVLVDVLLSLLPIDVLFHPHYLSYYNLATAARQMARGYS